jgi:spore coat polysaccharide biosynthesis protein SpsF
MMLPFGDNTVVGEVIERMRGCTLVDEMVFATSTHGADDVLEGVADAHGLACVRGSEDDVVSRMVEAVESLSEHADVIVRVCCDNALVMPSLVDEAVRALVDGQADVITPGEFASLPFGTSMVVLSRQGLERIDRQAVAPMYREHVENYCFDHPDAFRILYQWAPEGLEYRELSLTLDHAVDYARLSYWRERLADVAIEDQAQVLVQDAFAARAVLLVESGVDIEPFVAVLDEQDAVLAIDAWGRIVEASVPESKGRLAVDWLRTQTVDVVISTTDHVPLAQPRLGWLELCLVEAADGLRRGLRYASPRPAAFPEDPIIADWQSNTLLEGRLGYLERILPVALREIKAGPMRSWSHQERYVPPASKRAADSSRVGFSSAIAVFFPDEVVVEVVTPVADVSISVRSSVDITDIAQQMRGFPHTTLYLEVDTERMPEEVSRIRAQAEKILGLSRVRVRGRTRSTDEVCAFRQVRVSAAGVLSVPRLPVAVAPGVSSLGGFWRSPAVRKARVSMLNARSRGPLANASAA